MLYNELWLFAGQFQNLLDKSSESGEALRVMVLNQEIKKARKLVGTLVIEISQHLDDTCVSTVSWQLRNYDCNLYVPRLTAGSTVRAVQLFGVNPSSSLTSLPVNYVLLISENSKLIFISFPWAFPMQFVTALLVKSDFLRIDHSIHQKYYGSGRQYSCQQYCILGWIVIAIYFCVKSILSHPTRTESIWYTLWIIIKAWDWVEYTVNCNMFIMIDYVIEQVRNQPEFLFIKEPISKSQCKFPLRFKNRFLNNGLSPKLLYIS